MAPATKPSYAALANTTATTNNFYDLKSRAKFLAEEAHKATQNAQNLAQQHPNAVTQSDTDVNNARVELIGVEQNIKSAPEISERLEHWHGECRTALATRDVSAYKKRLEMLKDLRAGVHKFLRNTDEFVRWEEPLAGSTGVSLLQPSVSTSLSTMQDVMGSDSFKTWTMCDVFERAQSLHSAHQTSLSEIQVLQQQINELSRKSDDLSASQLQDVREVLGDNRPEMLLQGTPAFEVSVLKDDFLANQRQTRLILSALHRDMGADERNMQSLIESIGTLHLPDNGSQDFSDFVNRVPRAAFATKLALVDCKASMSIDDETIARRMWVDACCVSPDPQALLLSVETLMQHAYAENITPRCRSFITAAAPKLVELMEADAMCASIVQMALVVFRCFELMLRAGSSIQPAAFAALHRRATRMWGVRDNVLISCLMRWSHRICEPAKFRSKTLANYLLKAAVKMPFVFELEEDYMLSQQTTFLANSCSRLLPYTNSGEDVADILPITPGRMLAVFDDNLHVIDTENDSVRVYSMTEVRYELILPACAIHEFHFQCLRTLHMQPDQEPLFRTSNKTYELWAALWVSTLHEQCARRMFSGETQWSS